MRQQQGKQCHGWGHQAGAAVSEGGGGGRKWGSAAVKWGRPQRPRYLAEEQCLEQVPDGIFQSRHLVSDRKQPLSGAHVAL